MEKLTLEDLLSIIKFAPDGWEKYSPSTSKTFKSYAKGGFIYVMGGIMPEEWISCPDTEGEYLNKDDIISEIKSRLSDYTKFINL